MAERWISHSTQRRMTVVLALVICFSAFRSTFLDWHHVPTQSMLPTIFPGDRIIVSKSWYRLRLPFSSLTVLNRHQPERSDIVTFLDPQDKLLMVKRIIGLPGDRVEMEDNQIIINGARASYNDRKDLKKQEIVDPKFSHLLESNETFSGNSHRIAIYKIKPKWSQRSFEGVTIPASHYLVLGDNRDDSSDYRSFGLISAEQILGKVILIDFQPTRP